MANPPSRDKCVTRLQQCAGAAHAPLTPATKHLINADRLARMAEFEMVIADARKAKQSN